TLFDVRTGTLLFTVFERVHHASEENLWQNDRKRRAMKEQLLAEAAKKLADDVLTKTQDLVAARPRPTAPVARPAAPPVTTPPVAGEGEPGLRIVAPLVAGEAAGAAAP
ncbi:MAG: hypothetical protein KC635_02420, partial [Myxococcales bacterium]|nr:hypothetical protein [Myxococcales bacterium]